MSARASFTLSASAHFTCHCQQSCRPLRASPPEYATSTGAAVRSLTIAILLLRTVVSAAGPAHMLAQAEASGTLPEKSHSRSGGDHRSQKPALVAVMPTNLFLIQRSPNESALTSALEVKATRERGAAIAIVLLKTADVRQNTYQSARCACFACLCGTPGV